MNTSSTITSETAATLSERASIYTFLATALFEEIPVSLLERLQEAPMVFDNDLDAFIDSLKNQPLEQTRVDLAAEYARLFLGMSAHPISLNESAHTSDTHLIRQEAFDDAIEEYRQGGYAKAEGVSLDEDHLAIELDYLSRLCNEAARAAEEEDADSLGALISRQESFFNRHLRNWVPDLADTIIVRSTSPFYRGVAQTLQRFIDAEEAFFEEHAA